jgi:tRNA(adenine34) deaminase
MDAFEELVQQQTDRLKNKSLREIEQAVTEKRLNWWVNHPYLKTVEPVSPRYAFECLFFDYMGLKKDDLPILSESETQITWASMNPCPTLEACGRLKLDTRTVCRQAYEKSTQAFISQLDPGLRFVRSYSEIRPHASICRESIVRIDLEASMREAIEEAKASRHEGNKGYGTVVWYAGKVIARAHDTVGTHKGPSIHSDVNAIREACRVLHDDNLCGAVLISTCEPCPMCASLAVWANVSAIIYGASIKEIAALGKSRIQVTAAEIINSSQVQIEIIPGVLGGECLALYR